MTRSATTQCASCLKIVRAHTQALIWGRAWFECVRLRTHAYVRAFNLAYEVAARKEDGWGFFAGQGGTGSFEPCVNFYYNEGPVSIQTVGLSEG